ncbi:DUF4240 domain-containing protein [Micromonospora zamorensis]|uniref:DUF4240 domain-containing protein n=1 Tax=Micromonospora zamorensis TaxID=709883 RepID=UPI003CF04E50
MERAAFWQFVDECRAVAGADTERLAQVILRRLCSLSTPEILDYEEWWFCAQDELCTWAVRDAASLLLGGLGEDDDFLTVQDWIVSHGRATVERVLDNPDRIVDLAADRHNARMDWFCGLPVDAHIAVDGCPPAMYHRPGPVDPVGVPADLSDEYATRRRFPEITAYLDANGWIASSPDPGL